MKKNVSILFIVFLFCFSIKTFSQKNIQAQIDSLTTSLKSSKEDTTKVKTLLSLTEIYRHSNPEKCPDLIKQALSLSQKLNYQKGIGKTKYQEGLVEYGKGNFSKAKSKYLEALSIFDTLKDEGSKAKAIYFLGVTSVFLGDYSKANDNFFTALRIFEKLGDKKSVGDSYTGIANVYGRQGNTIKELEYHTKALNIKLAQKDDYGIAACYINIGNVYGREKKYDTAFTYYNKGLKLAEEMHNQRWILNALGNIGTIYTQQGKFKEGLDYLVKCFDIAEKIGDKQSMATTLNTIGGAYDEMGDKEKSKQYNEQALKIATEIGSKNEMKQSYVNLSTTYAELGDYKQAYSYHKLFSNMKDTILNEENSKQINEMQAKYDNEKQEQEITLLNKDKEIQTAHLKQKNIIIWSVGGGLAITVVLALFVLIQFKQKKKANLALESAYIQIEEKNTSITDSINYAKRIQTAILPSLENIQKHLSEVFVLYKPKDIVSGDFYWFTEKNGYSILAVADCTGHGVPGAFMSMIGNDLLTQIIIEKGISQPNLILTQLHEGVKNALKQDDRQSEAKDGMDIAIVKCKSENGKIDLDYSGALRPFWLIKKNETELQEIKPDKHSIGGSYSNDQRIFTNHSLTLLEGDTFYLTTDGYADQFGGETGKKMMTKNMKELIIRIQSSPMSQQKEILEKSLSDWQLNREQIDDVLVIGVRV